MTTDYVADVPDVPPAVREFADHWMACPDCASVMAGVVATPDGFRIYVGHQPTCPDPSAENTNRALVKELLPDVRT